MTRVRSCRKSDARLGCSQPWFRTWRRGSTLTRSVLGVGSTPRTQLLARLNRSLLEESGLSGADFEVLVTLSDAPGKRMRAVELGRALGWEKSRLSHQVTRMEARGLVWREECMNGSRGRRSS